MSIRRRLAEGARGPWARTLVRRLVVAAGLGFAGVYTGVSWYTADRLTRPTNRPSTVDPRRWCRDAEPWRTRTEDGLTLRGWRLPTDDRRRLLVLAHGMWGSWQDLASLGRDLHGRGYEVLLFDFRGHGQSDPARLSLGDRERADLRAVIRWAHADGYSDDRIGWLGYSMGASTLMLEAARNPAIRVLVMDSPYGDLPALLERQLSRYSGLPGWFNPGVLAAARWGRGLHAEKLVPIRAAGSWGGRPLLLIHGGADSEVPVEQALRLGRAAGAGCTTMILPGVEHVQAYNDDPVRYVARVADFFQDHLSP